MIIYTDHRLVPDYTVHKGTSKHHKMDEKAPILRCTFLYRYLEFKKLAHYTQDPFKNAVGFFLIPNADIETCIALLSVFLDLVPTQENVNIFVGFSFLASYFYTPK